MKYGEGFYVERAGKKVLRDSPYAYPATRGFEYCDGTGDRGDILVEPFTCCYRMPSTGIWYRLTVLGHSLPIIHDNAFDFDYASIDNRILRAMTCDKADYRIRVASLLHDALFSAHLPDFPLHASNVVIREVMEAYSDERLDDELLRMNVFVGVELFGHLHWSRPIEELATYRRLVRAEVMTHENVDP